MKRTHRNKGMHLPRVVLWMLPSRHGVAIAHLKLLAAVNLS